MEHNLDNEEDPVDDGGGLEHSASLGKSVGVPFVAFTINSTSSGVVFSIFAGTDSTGVAESVSVEDNDGGNTKEFVKSEDRVSQGVDPEVSEHANEHHDSSESFNHPIDEEEN